MTEETRTTIEDEIELPTGITDQLAVDVSIPDVIELPETAEAEVEPKLGRDYVKLWLATTISNIGDGARLTALPLLAATITRNPIAISGILFAAHLPWLLLSLHSGAIADRVDRRRLIVGVSSGRAVVMGVLVVAAFTDSVTLPMVYAVALAQGIGEVFSDNASFALMPSIVPRAAIEKANGRLEASLIVANEFAGPALGGLLFAVAVALPFSVDAISFVVAAALIASISPSRTTRGARKATTTIMSDIKEGLSFMWSHPVLRNLSLIGAATNLVLFATFGIQVLFVLEVLDLPAAAFGLLLTAEAVGAAIGSLLASRVRKALGISGAVFLALLIASGTNLVISMSSSWLIVGAMALGVSVGGGIWNVVTNSFRQTAVPDHLMGRVQSSHRVLAWGAIPIGTLFGGAVSHAFGLRAPFLIASIALAVLAVIVRQTMASSESASRTIVLSDTV